jgi:hypothetical protein
MPKKIVRKKTPPRPTKKRGRYSTKTGLNLGDDIKKRMDTEVKKLKAKKRKKK